MTFFFRSGRPEACERGAYAYVTNTTFVRDDTGEPRTDVNGTVTVIDTASRQVAATIEVGALPKRIHAVRVP